MLKRTVNTVIGSFKPAPELIWLTKLALMWVLLLAAMRLGFLWRNYAFAADTSNRRSIGTGDVMAVDTAICLAVQDLGYTYFALDIDRTLDALVIVIIGGMGVLPRIS